MLSRQANLHMDRLRARDPYGLNSRAEDHDLTDVGFVPLDDATHRVSTASPQDPEIRIAYTFSTSPSLATIS
jgi:hypothetical protein